MLGKNYEGKHNTFRVAKEDYLNIRQVKYICTGSYMIIDCNCLATITHKSDMKKISIKLYYM